jgi:predicted amidohydrolase YtcJ
MKLAGIVRVVGLAVVGLSPGSVWVEGAEADALFYNGVIHTVDGERPRAEAVAVREGRVIFVGSNADALQYRGEGTRVVDLGGRTLVPGLTDSHFHLSGVGMREMNLNLEGAQSLDEFLARVKERVDRARPRGWITGRGWIETFWKPQQFPTRHDLDSISPNHPVFLTRADGHGAVVNSLALKIAGITQSTPNPFGGEIMRDRKTGEATGMLLDTAQRFVTKHLPGSGEADRERALLLGQEFALRHGWCQVQIAGADWGDIGRLRKLYSSGRMKLRTYVAVFGPGASADRLIENGPILGEFENRLTVRGIKVMSDGALGSKGAAMLEPYYDHDSSGFMRVKEATLMPMLLGALRNGIQVETHAIGDRANRLILNYYERTFERVPAADRRVVDPRWRIEHAQHVHAEDIPRFAELGVIASMQPSHAIGDLHFAPSRLGVDRLSRAYAWKPLLDTGAKIAGGSDAPVERGDPMIEFYAAVARKDLKGFSGAGWHPEFAVTREQALKMLTLWPAYASFEEKIKGSIKVGKLADFTVLSADIMSVPVEEIPKVKCVMTVIGGEVVYRGEGL